MLKVKSYKSVWDALEDDPAKRAGLTARSELMMAICDAVEHWNLTKAQAAKRLGIAQSRLNALLRGKFNEFNLDELVELAGRAGLKPRIMITKKHAA